MKTTLLVCLFVFNLNQDFTLIHFRNELLKARLLLDWDNVLAAMPQKLPDVQKQDGRFDYKELY